MAGGRGLKEASVTHFKMMLAVLVLGTSGALVCPVPSAAEVYYYKDADGSFHFSNVPRPGSAVYIVAAPNQDDGQRDVVRSALRKPIGGKELDSLIQAYADSHDVEPALVKAVIRAESGFNSKAVSPKGARGLMQLMPQTARQHGCRNVYDASQNIEAGVKHLRMLLDQYGNNLPRVLAAYNAGVAPVERYGGIPPYAETQSYVTRVLNFRRQYLRQQRLTRSTKVAKP
ncbi:MAG: transglycosylase SLT domain-containing protein [Candidatus Binatia bacterium]